MILFKIFQVLELTLNAFPYRARRTFFIALANFAYLVDKKHRKIVDINLDIAFKDTLTKKHRKDISKYCYKNIVLNLFQVMNKKNMKKEEISNLVTFENERIIEDAKKSDRPIIMITAHYGNWEIMNVGLAKLFEKTNVVYKKLNNPYFDRYLCDSREKFNTNMIEKRGALRALSSALKSKEPLSLLIDQNTSPKDGVEINFFDKIARQSAAPAQLARKYNAIIIPVFVTTNDEENYIMSFQDPIEVEHSHDAQKDILDATQKQADIIAAQIIKEPKFWFWCHRRWRTGNEELY